MMAWSCCSNVNVFIRRLTLLNWPIKKNSFYSSLWNDIIKKEDLRFQVNIWYELQDSAFTLINPSALSTFSLICLMFNTVHNEANQKAIN